MNLNQSALRNCEALLGGPHLQRLAVIRDESGARVIDCGVHVVGGLDVGCRLAEICLAGLGQVTLGAAIPGLGPVPVVVVRTDLPVLACMASQYAGWQIAGEKFFAMGSGPMRAVRGREKLFEALGYQESAFEVLGVLESGKLPTRDVCHHIAEECRVDPERLTLLVAPTASLAGTIQVVARTVETALHKLHELGFDLRQVCCGMGMAPLPPVARNDLEGIGRTNDAVLYGGDVTLWVTAEDAALESLGPQVPSAASRDFGRPFGELFRQYNHDFYKIDPLLFSPAVVQMVNLKSGRHFRFGELRPDILQQSWA
ncbi:MAG: methenyltetrahydromethanopterin cyclohydrolase [Pirellulaceae bacterium]